MVDNNGRSAFAIPGAEQWTMTGRTGRRYRIMAWMPDAAVPEAGFPVIYMLDANAAFGTMVETVRLLGQGPYRVDPSVVIGIGYETDRPLDTQARFYDYTVYAADDELPPRKDRSPWPATGGAADFLQFIEEELKPSIERLYTIDRSRQMLFGHSLGRWFVLYALFRQCDAFQYYVAGSPSIWWKNGYIVPDAERFAESGKQADWRASLLIGVGSLEKPHMVRDARQMYERLLAADIPGFTVQYRCYEDEGHLSVVAPLIGRAVRFLDPNHDNRPKS